MSASTPKKGHGRGPASLFADYVEPADPSFPELAVARERMLPKEACLMARKSNTDRITAEAKANRIGHRSGHTTLDEAIRRSYQLVDQLEADKAIREGKRVGRRGRR